MSPSPKVLIARERIIRRRSDGSWRDTVLYGIVDDDWPQVKQGLTARLAAQPRP